MGFKNNQYSHNVVLVTGERNCGKTLFCLDLIRKLHPINITVKGIVSPGQYLNNKKSGIIARDIHSGEERLLATYSPGWDPEKPEREWLFNYETFKWGNEKLEKSTPTEVLIIDELGFMEFDKKEGWNNALTILENGKYRVGIVVVRPMYISIAKKLWNVKEVIRIDRNHAIENIIINLIKNHRMDIR